MQFICSVSDQSCYFSNFKFLLFCKITLFRVYIEILRYNIVIICVVKRLLTCVGARTWVLLLSCVRVSDGYVFEEDNLTIFIIKLVSYRLPVIVNVLRGFRTQY